MRILLLLALSASPLLAQAEPFEMVVDGIRRVYLVHEPTHRSALSPVVIVLNPGLRSARESERSFGFNSLAEKEGFIVAYPESLPIASGQQSYEWNFDDERVSSHADDVKFIGLVIDALLSKFQADPKKVFVTGLSAGAMMAYRLACTIPERISAIAAVAGSLEHRPCAPTQGVTVFDIHGTEDQLLPFEGGGIQHFNSRDATVAFWKKVNGCEIAGLATLIFHLGLDSTRSFVHDYDCIGGARLKSIVIDGGGHNWAGKPIEYPYIFGRKVTGPVRWRWEREFLGEVSFDFDATDYIWKFFNSR